MIGKLAYTLQVQLTKTRTYIINNEYYQGSKLAKGESQKLRTQTSRREQDGHTVRIPPPIRRQRTLDSSKAYQEQKTLAM
jgi:hypothetical protein